MQRNSWHQETHRHISFYCIQDQKRLLNVKPLNYTPAKIPVCAIHLKAVNLGGIQCHRISETRAGISPISVWVINDFGDALEVLLGGDPVAWRMPQMTFSRCFHLLFAVKLRSTRPGSRTVCNERQRFFTRIAGFCVPECFLCFKAFCFSTLWWLCEILGRWFCKCWHATLKAKFFDKIFAHHIVQMCCVSPGLWRGSPMEFLSFFFLHPFCVSMCCSFRPQGGVWCWWGISMDRWVSVCLCNRYKAKCGRTRDKFGS